MRTTLPFLSSLLAAAASLAAQQSVPLPVHAPAVDGHQSASLPFGAPGFRTQLLLDGAVLAPNGALISGLRFRADRLSQPTTGGTVPNVTVQISNTTAALGNMATTFAGNVTSPPTTVFTGAVTLPAYPASVADLPGPLPWDIVIPFATPWLCAASANVLVDITGNNAPNAQPTYWLDAVQGGGSATTFGTRGDNPTSDNLLLGVSTGNSLEPRLLTPGHGIDFNSGLSFTQPPGVLALGLQAQPVPIDLGVIGAPTNTLYIDPLVLAAHAWTPSFIGFFSTFTLAVPSHPALVGTLVYGQSAIFEPTANALGLVLSAAVEVRVGEQGEPLVLQQLDAFDPAAANGTMLDFGFGQPEFGATPVLVEGVIF
jgi:hypothetical protein